MEVFRSTPIFRKTTVRLIAVVMHWHVRLTVGVLCWRLGVMMEKLRSSISSHVESWKFSPPMCQQSRRCLGVEMDANYLLLPPTTRWRFGIWRSASVRIVFAFQLLPWKCSLIREKRKNLFLFRFTSQADQMSILRCFLSLFSKIVMQYARKEFIFSNK